MDKSTSPARSPGKSGVIHSTLVYMRQHWQLYLLFILPAFLLTLIFKETPHKKR